MAERVNPFKGKAECGTAEHKALDAAEVRRALALLCDPAGEAEVRCLRPNRSAVRSGSDVDGLTAAALAMGRAAAIYLCLNPVELGAPCGRAASDKDVTRRRWLFLDVDSIRPKDVCATDAEKKAALDAAAGLKEHLAGLGWPEPVEVDSGNGAYLLYRIDLPSDEASALLCRRVLHALAEEFPGAKLDRAVHNASRIARLPGTWNQKGRNVPDRPHRLCRLLSVPERLGVVTREQLEATAGPAQEAQPLNGATKERNPFKGRASDSRLQAYARNAINSEVLCVVMATRGHQGGHGANNTLNEAAFKLGTMLHWQAFDEVDVVDVLTQAGRRAGLEEGEILPTILSGLGAGKGAPRPLPPWAAHQANGEAAPERPADPAFPPPIPASQLKAVEGGVAWVWNGFLCRGEVTLLSALWKAGKTTLLAHLLKAMEAGGEFLGRQVQMARILYVTEESEPRWAERRDQHHLTDHVEFQIRPFAVKPRNDRWEAFLAHLGGLIVEKRYDVVIFDTLANLWPVRDENDASAVQTSLMPLHSITEQVALLLVHHNRKGDGQEATASRGSGALTGFVDTILEFRRYAPQDRKDRRRVITGYGRHDETPHELVIDLAAGGYVSLGEREEVADGELAAAILRTGLLPRTQPGLTADQIHERWPDGQKPRPGLARLKEALQKGAEQTDPLWEQAGGGVKGSPRVYWLPPATEGEVPAVIPFSPAPPL